MLAHLPNLLISQESPVFHSSLPVSSQGHNSPTFLLIEHNFPHFSPFSSSQPVPGYQRVVCRAGAPRHPQAVRDRQKKWRRDRILKHISDTLERRIPISYVKFFFFLKEMRRKICQACFFLSITVERLTNRAVGWGGALKVGMGGCWVVQSTVMHRIRFMSW